MRSLRHDTTELNLEYYTSLRQIVTAVELQSSKTGAILMEFCPRGHLLEALNNLGGKRMEEEAVLSVMCDIVRCAAVYLFRPARCPCKRRSFFGRPGMKVSFTAFLRTGVDGFRSRLAFRCRLRM